MQSLAKESYIEKTQDIFSKVTEELMVDSLNE